MTQGARLVDLVQNRLDRHVDERASIFTAIAEEATPFAGISRQFLRGGKRFRALFCWEGWQCVDDDRTTDPDVLDAVVTAASALELFHAAALVHDDLIDSSDTRRGAPSAHRRFERLHVESGYSGNPETFGRAAAILLGDLLQSWSDELLTEGLRRIPSPTAASAARAEYERMRLEVTAGQYLDLVEERAWPVVSEADALPRAERVILYKSAKYSVEAPLVIGASLAGGSLAQVAALRDFGVPLGIAFQLRDDLLGVFGDPEVTGKPAGDDLVEGKRTVLVALTRATLAPGPRRLLDELLGDPDLEPAQIELLQTTIRRSGAVELVERMIDENAGRAREALAVAPISSTARRDLAALVEPLTRRTS
ncbi:MAG: geranylgeranyl pyrophosphate synthase [Naasia sp.]|uniref:polyprenyl synthetase family protein n=1 Tax=Naasia sp. TaxID=2546198 RepID=UPI002610A8BB|nr:polyprenyl synthetase family protein [Naasia sp.]MCU1569291.1 geranylgeranyl pyrophosphate synthase [Naasia sp.]